MTWPQMGWLTKARQKSVLRHAALILTISSMAVAPASRWGRWGSRRGRQRCWRRGAGGRRSSWGSFVQLAPPAGAASRKVSGRLAASGCTGEVYSIYSIYPHTQYLSRFLGKQMFSLNPTHIYTLIINTHVISSVGCHVMSWNRFKRLSKND